MSLVPHTLLGPYEILAPIGAGGMGEVWKARDTRLDRIVALKVSKTEFSERFEREAHAIAALNHPNICQLYDVGPNYLVMEYIEGTPLKGPLPLDQTLKYAAQICDALDAAHKKGITHRDLKPGNVLVTKTGIKLLDFGLAKFASTMTAHESKPVSAKNDDATLTMALTGKNEIVGTLYYMSPEQLQAQATGKEIDARSDIFSFGLVLYEMLTGKRAFDGASPASVIAGIMERPAPSIASVAPPALDRLLQKCLVKDLDDRWQSSHDLKTELEWIASASGQTATVRSEVMPRRLLPWMVAAGVLAIGLIVAVVGWYRATPPAALKPLVRLDVDLGPDVSLGSQTGADAILSPDGTRLVYVSKGKLFTRKLDQPNATELAGTEGAFAPFFSPDGQSVAFFTGNKVKKLSVEGGEPVVLCDAPLGFGGSWGEDGNIVASLAFGPLLRIPSAGGAPTPVTEPGKGEVTHAWPQVLPGGKAVLFTSSVSLNFNGANIEVISLKDHRRKALVRGGTYGRYVAGSNGAGYLVYVNSGTLFAVAFDLDRLEVRGTPVPVLEQVAYNPAFGSAQLDVSQTGMLLYRSGGAGGGGLVTVQWLDSNGKTQPLLAKPGTYARPHVSPDGQRVALEISEGASRDIWIYEVQRNALRRLTFDAGLGVPAMNPVWSPDSRYVAFAEKGGVFWTRSDGAGKPQLLTQNPVLPTSFTPDGKRLALMEPTANGRSALWTMPLESDGTGLRAGKPELLLQDSFDERTPTFSPDGRWLAYTSNESGPYQIYVRAFPDKGAKWQISIGGGAYPVWSHNGGELFFRSADNRIMVASYTVKGDSIVADQPRVWSEEPLATFGVVGFQNFDPAPDGKRVVALMPVETPESQQTQNHVIFLENFFDELRRKVPLNK